MSFVITASLRLPLLAESRLKSTHGPSSSDHLPIHTRLVPDVDALVLEARPKAKMRFPFRSRSETRLRYATRSLDLSFVAYVDETRKLFRNRLNNCTSSPACDPRFYLLCVWHSYYNRPIGRKGRRGGKRPVRCCLISAARQSTLLSKAVHQRQCGIDTRDIARRYGTHGALAGDEKDVIHHRGH